MDNSLINNGVNGNINISESVISNIAKVATMEVEGVNSLTKGVTSTISEFISNGKYPTGIKVESDNHIVNIDLSIEVKYGYSINDVAYNVQKNVKTAIENMTTLIVETINVTVSGLVFDNKN